MINFYQKNILVCFFTIIIIFITNNNLAKEILIYADDISYDEDNNIIAKGKAKIIYDNQIITSDLIIYSRKNEQINLPTDFTFMI